MDSDEYNLDMLAMLLGENGDDDELEHQDCPATREPVDDLDALFDEDDDEEYREEAEEERPGGASGLFGDVEDLEAEESDVKGQTAGGDSGDDLNKSKEDLQEELRRMQDKMQRLQQLLDVSQRAPAVPSTPGRPSGTQASPKPRTPPQGPSRQTSSKPPPPTQRSKPQTVKPSSSPESVDGPKLQESSDFTAQLVNADSFKRKPRVAHPATASTSAGSSSEDRGPLVEIKMGSTFLPVESVNKPLRPPPASQAKALPLPPAPKDVAVEKYSGLRLRRPRVSSTEMDRKMADRRLIRLSQLPERLAREKLEDSDWVTFGVLVNKATPQSNSSGKTFSIWKLNDLHNLDVFVSLLLFGEVHKEHWKTEPGTVIGVLNPNPMKQKDGYDGVSLSVDHAQKVMLMGEAQDYGTCKAAKKNGDPCSQIVNLYECQYCQYHVKAQYKKMSSKRAELQSSFSGKAAGKVKGKGRGSSLKDRLCNEGFYYGGVSSSACASSLSRPNKQSTLDTMFVKGSAQLAAQAKRLAMQSGEVSGCSDDFRSLLSAPTPGALQLKKHLTQPKPSGSPGGGGGEVQSISASDLLKQQKRMQLELLENRKRRAEEIQRRVLENSGKANPGASSLPGQGPLQSPKAPSEAPKASSLPSRGASSLPSRAPLQSPKAPSEAPKASKASSLPSRAPLQSPKAPSKAPKASSLPSRGASSLPGQGPLQSPKAPSEAPKASSLPSRAPRQSPKAPSKASSLPSRGASSLPGQGPLQSPKASSLPSRAPLQSPKAPSEAPKATRSPPAARAPTLGRGFSDGEDILFFDHNPLLPPPPSSSSSSLSLSAGKLAALRKLRAKGAGLQKEDPNAVKRKRSNGDDIAVRVEKNLRASPDGGSPGAEEEEEPAQKKRREQQDYIQSEEFQNILNAKSIHGALLQAEEYQIQERYFDVLVKKEQMEDKMRGVREMKCRAVSCKKCNYTYFKPADRCVEENHALKWHDVLKRFFKCPCGQRAIALDRLPHKTCSNCGLFKWERDGMLKEKAGPKIGGELLQPRGEEHGRFLSSMM